MRDPCATPDSRLAALLDGELPEGERQRLEAHVRACVRCAADLQAQRTVQAALRRSAAILVPTPALLARLQARLDRVDHVGARRWPRRWAMFFGGLAAAVALLAAAGLIFGAPRAPSAATLTQVVDAHQQETLGGAPVSFASQDTTEVAAWARDHTKQSVEIPSLEPAGYRLLGVRLESTVAPAAFSLVYEGRDGRLTCTILPATIPVLGRLPLPDRPKDIRATRIQGMGLASWVEGDAAYIMVADLESAAMLRLAHSAVANGS